jgi:ABC-2 type transport system permease protein
MTSTSLTATRAESTVQNAMSDPPERRQPRSGPQLRSLIGRNLRKTLRNPELLTFSTLMPLAMLVLFSQVFRSIAESPGFPVDVSYIDYLAPAMIAVSTVMAATNSGITMATDLTTGMIDRLRSLPIKRWAPLAAHTVADQIFTAVRVLLLAGAAAVLLGFRLHGSPAESVAAFAVVLPLGFAMGSLFVLLGARLRDPAVVESAGMMIMMPFMFISSAFAPLETMPRWLQIVAKANPVTHTIDAGRGYVLGQPDHRAAVGAVLASTALAIVAIGVTAKTDLTGRS